MAQFLQMLCSTTGLFEGVKREELIYRSQSRLCSSNFVHNLKAVLIIRTVLENEHHYYRAALRGSRNFAAERWFRMQEF